MEPALDWSSSTLHIVGRICHLFVGSDADAANTIEI
jgi:hypothetical protein